MGLSFRTKLSYGVGHVLNDLCSAIWFTYLLLFFHHVLKFENELAGVILLIGQVADALSTPFVGFEVDRTDDLWLCIAYGRRKTWHLIGTLCVILTFPFIFLGCIGCNVASPVYQVFYFAPFVVIFQFGWAATQISHLAILPHLSSDPHDRTELNAIRYAFTVLSTITVYCVTWAILGVSSQNSVVSPDDAINFRNIAFIIIGIGLTFSIIFHVWTRETKQNDTIVSTIENIRRQDHQKMRWSDWLKEIQFYQVAVLYMSTRLFCNLTQVYVPMFLEDTLTLQEDSIAYIPLVINVSGFITTTTMKPINMKMGRKATFLLGCVIGLSGAMWVYFGNGEYFKSYSIYVIAVLLGSGGSTMLVTSLSITADFIGENVESGGFVYGAMSFTDKLSNGIVVMLIQFLTPSISSCTECKGFFRFVISFACGGAAIVAMLGLASFGFSRIGTRKRFIHEELLNSNEANSSLTYSGNRLLPDFDSDESHPLILTEESDEDQVVSA